MRGLGDIVAMPLPTQWSPDVQYQPLVFPQVQRILGQRNSDGLILLQGSDGQVQGVYPQQLRPNADGSVTLTDPSGKNALAKLIHNSDGTVSVVGTYPQASVDLTPAQYYAGGGRGQADYGTPGAVVPGDTISEVWPTLTVPGVALQQRPGSRSMTPQPVIPDSMLPLALQRFNPLAGRRTDRNKNQYDASIQREADFWSYVASHGGLKSCCLIPSNGNPLWDQPDWQVMPPNGAKFEQMAGQPVTAFQQAGVFTGLDTVILRFQVPIGYDGVINRLIFGYTGNGFTDFSGSIVWRAKVGARFVRNMGNVRNTYGSFGSPFLVPATDNMRLISGQTVTLYANIPADSPVQGGQVTAGAFGWLSPRQ